ncbi:hypothetical protein MmiEs2_13740 [Methanimicrococcus stummii]|uniref:Uncharacterized protein n=1 Tax=Methanimicrococcus stummii TaxID=3028294 RepID=A0AA96VB16_9EURY|nr:hypothetical protein [Methanimicrococcus sp. Es2]WNY29156.1 hypothetical protein MmiEs2_13740 [Methanimicrococcus sp. Es2]
MFQKSVNFVKSAKQFSNKSTKTLFQKTKEMFRDESGVSVIFGALLLLSILALFISLFLTAAIPAKIMAEESAENDRLLSDILKFSETNDSGSFSFHSNHSTIHVFESEKHGIYFSADISIPPETESFLKAGAFSGEFDSYRLSSGGLLFSCDYSQIPDCDYFLGDSSLLLIQDDGFSYLLPPVVNVYQNQGNILISLSGDLVRSTSSSVFGNLTTVNYKIIQTAEVYDFVSEIRIYYVPPESKSKLNPDSVFGEIETVQKEAFSEWLFQFEKKLNRDFPELKTELETESDFENLTLIISSETPFEIDITVHEIEYLLF